jgi:hypothetical protein
VALADGDEVVKGGVAPVGLVAGCGGGWPPAVQGTHAASITAAVTRATVWSLFQPCINATMLHDWRGNGRRGTRTLDLLDVNQALEL